MRYRITGAAVIIVAIFAAGCSSGPTPMQKWQAGPGGKCLAKVEQALKSTSSTALTQIVDAANCTANPPPVGGAAFNTVMGDLTAAAVLLGGTPALQGGDAAQALAGGSQAWNDAKTQLGRAPAGATWAPALLSAMSG